MVFITASVTGIINYVVSPNTALYGASGIVFAFIVLSSFTGFKEGEIPLTFILVLILFVGQQFYEGSVINDNVSQFSHILGGAIGAIMGYNLNKKGRVV